MPNLVAIVDRTASKEALGADLDRMMDAVDLPAFHFPRRAAIEDGVAAGNVLPGMNANLAQPARSGRRWLMLDGEILGVQALKDDLRRAGREVDTDDDAELAMTAFEVFGPDFYQRMNGTWNMVFHDGDSGATYVVTDRLGSRLLFFAHDAGRLVCANEMKGVIAGRKVASRPGGVGLMALLSAGGHHGTRTWISGIETVPPGTVIRIDREGRRTDRRYWRFAFNEGGPEMSEEDYAAAFARSLRAATERAMKLSDRFPIAITLSGGLDSRAVALSIDKRHIPMEAITYGDPDSNDVRFARQLAEVIGLRHLYIESLRPGLEADSERVFKELTGVTEKPGFYSMQADRILWRCEALTNFDGLASMIWHPVYKKHMRFMLNGAAGDAMTGSHLTPDLMLYPDREKVVDSFVRRFFFMPQEVLRKVLNPSFYADWGPERDRVFRSDFNHIDADEPLAVANTWDMENRQRRGAFTSFVMERYFCDCRSPFLDYELDDMLARVPGRWRFQQRIYKRMLVKHFPEAAHVPWAYTGGRITASPTYEFAREVFNFGRARAKRMLQRGPGRAKQRWDFRDVVGLMRADTAMHEMLDAFTRSDLFPSEVFDAQGVRELAEDYRRDGSHVQHVMFTNLVGIGRVMQMLMGPGKIELPPTADPARFGVPTE
ncbi:MAG: hypothetical protein KC933_00890 [Myxococcales bacterium]|nr:hypothetical protein [Myxococcales bacterium]